MADDNMLQITLTDAERDALADFMASWPKPLTPAEAVEMLLHDALVGIGVLALDPEDDEPDR